MAERTNIAWCDSTFNPVVGCTKLSAACDNCYAASWAKRTGQAALWNGERRRTAASTWKAVERWNRRAPAFMREHGHRQRVFCASLADVFDNQWEEGWRHDLWSLIARCPNLDFLILTKRPQNILKMMPRLDINAGPWPWPHVWLGTTVENQEEADRRIPHLLAVPAAKRFLSCEPLLGQVDLTPWLQDGIPTREQIEDPQRGMHYLRHGTPRLDWVICGGESGSHARPMRIEWARALRDQCQAAGVAFFMKQWGEWLDADARRSQGFYPPLDHPLTWAEAAALAREQGLRYGHQSDGSTLIRVGKHAAGRRLDGREHGDFPVQSRCF